MMVQAASALSVVPLLKSMMVPSEYQSEIAPDAGISGVNAFIHNIKCSFTYDVKPDPVAGAEGAQAKWNDFASFTSGMYLSLPQESHESLWHMGFVKPGAEFSVLAGGYAFFPVEATRRGFDIRAHYFGPYIAGSTSTCSFFPDYKLTYNGELALPRIGTNVGITYATSVSNNYSKVRAFAADFKMSSTTISGTNFNMSGTFHSAVISDTRYISQVSVDVSAARNAYPPAMLLAQSVTKPDDLDNSEIMKGAIDIMGPDYPREWCSVDVDATDTLNSQWQTFQYVIPSGTPIVNQLQASQAISLGPRNVAQLWVTSTDTSFYISNSSAPVSNGAPANWQRFYYGAINEDGILDIDVSLRASLASSSAVMLSPCQYDYVANFIHVFAYIDETGYVRYNMASETQKVGITALESYAQLSQFNNGLSPPALMTGTTQIPNMPASIVKSRPRMQRNGMSVNTGGKYLGTLVTLSMLFNSQEVPTDQVSVYAYSSSIRVRARNVDAPGRVGPAHIIRYDGLGVGQQMSFAGTTWLQGIALGQLAPFINSNGTALTVPDNIFSKFVELLWAYSPKYRRIMTLSDYNQFVKPYFRDLTLKELVSSIASLDDDTSSIIRNLGISGGFLDAATLGRYGAEVAGQQNLLPGFLGRALNGALGGPVVREVVGEVLGLNGGGAVRRMRDQ